MKQIPQQELAKFIYGLEKNNIPVKFHAYYKKWLRYYLDYCSKYRHDSEDPESLKHFIFSA